MTVVVVVAILGPVGRVVLFSLFARLGSWATPAPPAHPQPGQALALDLPPPSPQNRAGSTRPANRERATRTLRAYEINGVRVLAYDQQGSVAADRVADELAADTYGLGAIPFRPGDTVIDIGAHVGLVSLYLAKRWPLLHIHAFEPYAVNHEACLENLRVNHVTNVRLYREAVTTDARPIVLRCLPSNTGGATAVFAMPGADAAAAVRSTTLREVFERALEPGKRCRLLKMDCEGMEYEILPSPVLDRVDFFAAEFHEDALGGGSQPTVGHGAAQALAERCARFLRPEQLRIVCCAKQD